MADLLKPQEKVDPSADKKETVWSHLARINQKGKSDQSQGTDRQGKNLPPMTIEGNSGTENHLSDPSGTSSHLRNYMNEAEGGNPKGMAGGDKNLSGRAVAPNQLQHHYMKEAGKGSGNEDTSPKATGNDKSLTGKPATPEQLNDFLKKSDGGSGTGGSCDGASGSEKSLGGPSIKPDQLQKYMDESGARNRAFGNPNPPNRLEDKESGTIHLPKQLNHPKHKSLHDNSSHESPSGAKPELKERLEKFLKKEHESTGTQEKGR
jgi:hypothetical protein